MSLRDRALRGGAYLTGREAAGMIIRLAGVLLVTRLIGPANFGLYAGAVAVVTVLALVAQMGAELFLIRREHEPSAVVYDQVFSVLVATAAAMTGVALIGSLAATEIVHEPQAVGAFRVLALTIPINVLWAPAQAKLERSFRFGRMAVAEIGGDLVLYGTAVPLAWLGAGVWAPVAGYAAWQAWLLIACCVLSGYRPRWNWSGNRARELLRYGLEFSPAGVLYRAEALVNPVVVGSVLGAASVGYVALVVRLVETLSFAMRATWRLSIVALGRVQSDVDRLRRGFEEAMSLQLLALGPILAVFAVLASWVIPLVFGERWTPAIDLYPFIAAGALLLSVINMHFAVLYVRQRNLVITRIAVWRLGLLAASAVILVPAFGLVGFGLAALVPHLTLLIADHEVRKLLAFRYRLVPLWMVAFMPALFAPLLPRSFSPLLLALAGALALTPRARAELVRYGATIRGALRAG